MAQDDKLFVGEVVGDVREENIFNVLKTYKWVIIGVVALVIGAIVTFEIYKSNQEKKAIAQTDATMSLLDGRDVDNNSQSALENGAALSQMLLAKELEAKGDLEGAIAIYNKVSGDGTLSAVDRALASLNKFAIDDSLVGGALVADGAPFEVEANLILAQKLLDAQKTEEALSVLESLQRNPKANAIGSLVEMMVLQNGGELVEETAVPADVQTELEGDVDAQVE